ncbi:lipopolysaccharide biosynthesis protein [Methylobacterium gregans]|uniref:Polysaccharide biosynthesis protein n=1 Tax=Methylobacterium gregans TaxID=374424 RepID=A0AA37HU83_9HYPH|nr:hypothetical protein [Methylobacterium gregans]MDQ0522046.1 O-antigen/teichoic acid export membrane protein [Methylobacterium gregans]GJD81686.1 hypothetical protein NBEOAGPD_4940 [Methylobacterium gregans]GLS51917.1 polysaccharide export related protein [Methylobacterium gregans]
MRGFALARLGDLRARAGLRDLALALVLKVGGSGLAFLMLTLAARAMGLHEFGVFAYWFSALSFAAAAVLLGQEAAIMIDWQRGLDAGGPASALAALRRSGLVVLLAGLAGGAATACAGHLAGAGWLFSGLAGAFAALLAGLVYGTHVARVVAGIARGDGQFELTWRLFPTAGAALALVAGLPFHAETFFACATGGILVALVIQGLGIAAALRDLPTGAGIAGRTAAPVAAARDSTRAWISRSAKLWLGGVLDAANQYVDVFLIGLLLSPVEAGLYYAAARLAALFAIVSAGLHVFSSREIARHAADPAGPGMREALRLVGGATALAVGGGVLVVATGGQLLLDLFGPAFHAAYLPLVILTVGVAAIALGGPVPAVMRLTGHEAAYARIAGLFVLVRCTCVAAASLADGLTGATLASALCSIACAVVLNASCRRRVGIDPSVFGLVGAGRARGTVL